MSARATTRITTRRLERWRKQRPFDKPALFAKRLELDSLTEVDLASLLEPQPETTPASQPAWVDAVAHAQSIQQSATRPAQNSADDTDTTGIEPAKALAEPFVASALGKLYQRARGIHERYPDAPFNPERAVRLFEPSLWTQLVNRALKVTTSGVAPSVPPATVPMTTPPWLTTLPPSPI